jgi:hypothetical protein
VVHDCGHEVEVRKLMRRLRVYNYVPSQFGGPTRNLPLVRLLEDAVPRSSFHSQLIQLCDYVAFSLLRREARRGGRGEDAWPVTPARLREVDRPSERYVVDWCKATSTAPS